eukprot:TRINITY_DN3328_c0_g2_i3.p1 TRINITY_DN3328_c0_g2~~TRINITY_DN3328_c0_g2_i3.p1  ORF type:complete len:245 (-),score=63.34 TRINITY_DN3328_c0_g2_i3:145-879(-)
MHPFWFSCVFFFFFFKQKTAYEMQRGLVGSEMCIRDSYYGEFVKTILEGTASEEENRRQASLYGIGAIAINSGEYFKNVALKCLEAIKKTVDDKKPKNYEKKKWKITRDNAISSLGKIIKFQGYELAQTVPYWISHLPLKKDEEEGIIQNEILADLILANCKLIIGENCELLESVLKIFVKVLETKQVDESVSLKISQALSLLASFPEVKSRMMAIGASLSASKQRKLESCLALCSPKQSFTLY